MLLAIGCAGWMVMDELRRPQPMAIMNWVWPITALYAGPLGLISYYRWAHEPMPRPDGSLTPGAVIRGTLHCGAGCALGDLLAELLLQREPALGSVLGQGHWWVDRIYSAWILDFVFAYLFGIAFQYSALRSMRIPWPRRRVLARALQTGTLSLIAWQLGMYGFMVLGHSWFYPSFLRRSWPTAGVEFWFVMQGAMVVGFAAAAPINAWLIRHHIKEAM